MIRISKIWQALLLIPLFFIGTEQATAVDDNPAAQHCFSDWATAAALVNEHNLVTVEKLGAQFRRQNVGSIVNTQLCRTSSKYQYRLVVRTPKGRFETKSYDAHLGIEVGIAGRE